MLDLPTYFFFKFVPFRDYSEGRKSYSAYISEGIGKLQDWEMVMTYQRKNGSLFNSPSATAAAFMHFQDAGCLNYLRTVLKKFRNAGNNLHICLLFMHSPYVLLTFSL